ncbi:hypothetical protein YPC_4647 [Yersinia pestis biovar Medievalis str. Harbin 35]|nr:hypothetical protein YPC_4647 [Yersinia pestis biovar Medievalis str. Harbin 35]EEO86244.1 hypothetical protein YPH_2153 [Yersinia pestis biovar Orientalis str. PEXU2]
MLGRWLPYLTPTTYFISVRGFTQLPPSRNLNYLG